MRHRLSGPTGQPWSKSDRLPRVVRACFDEGGGDTVLEAPGSSMKCGRTSAALCRGGCPALRFDWPASER